ncbi:MAG TPA: hypothetical protein VL225_02385 [Vicinamibacterales bacterium]|jgi:hypothetical protein|nr:hypothetical protein [Vicinamibacterales bacterium]
MRACAILLLLAGARFGMQAQRSGISDPIVIDRILAVVGGQPIMQSDVDAAIQFRLVDVPPGSAAPRVAALDRMIERTLILAEVERFQPPEPAPVEIAVRVDEMERRAGSTAAFEKALAVTGLSREQLRRDVRDDLRIATYLNQRFVAVADPNERKAATAAWVAELRRRAEITVLSSGK